MDVETTGAFRITINDGEQTISFLTNRNLALGLVAGCAVNPLSLEELLLATEVYQRGISAWLMGELMEFDKAWQRQGQPYLQRAFESGANVAEQPAAFQVVDDLTGTAAYQPSDDGLLVIDLTEHRIDVAGDLTVPAEGQVLVHTGGRLTEQAITYILPQRWQIETLS